MPEKFKQKYAIQSTRLPGYDYSQNGMYFVTICARGQECFFGEVKNGKMILNEIGKIADRFWREIPKHFPFIKLDVHQIMPNHLHGNLEIIDAPPRRDAINRASTGNRVSTGGITGKYNPMGKNSLGEIIRWYKGRCKFEINKQLNSVGFSWQSRFYDRVIRNGTELQKIREYIINNPKMWERDRNNAEGIWI